MLLLVVVRFFCCCFALREQNTTNLHIIIIIFLASHSQNEHGPVAAAALLSRWAWSCAMRTNEWTAQRRKERKKKNTTKGTTTLRCSRKCLLRIYIVAGARNVSDAELFRIILVKEYADLLYGYGGRKRGAICARCTAQYIDLYPHQMMRCECMFIITSIASIEARTVRAGRKHYPHSIRNSIYFRSQIVCQSCRKIKYAINTF